MIDKTKWMVVEEQWYTVSGLPEIVATFMFRYQAEEWLKPQLKQARHYNILRREVTK